jgi:hypothetical protein
MRSHLLDLATHYRQRAARLRKKVRITRKGPAHSSLLELADSWDKMATAVEHENEAYAKAHSDSD